MFIIDANEKKMKTHFSFSWSEPSTSIQVDIDANEKKIKALLGFLLSELSTSTQVDIEAKF